MIILTSTLTSVFSTPISEPSRNASKARMLVARSVFSAFTGVQHIARSASSRYISMKSERGGIPADERFLFDLNGFLVLRGILSPEEVAAANAAIDAKQSLMQARDTAALRNTKAGEWPRLEPSRQQATRAAG